MVKRLFAGTVGINFDYFEKCLHFGPKLPYIKSGFSKNQGGYEKLEFKHESDTVDANDDKEVVVDGLDDEEEDFIFQKSGPRVSSITHTSEWLQLKVRSPEDSS